MSTEPLKLSKSQQKKAAREADIRDQEAKRSRAKQSWTWLLTGLAGLVASVIFFPLGTLVGGRIALSPSKVVSVPPTLTIIPQKHPDEDTLDLGRLLSLTPSQLEGIDIAVLNLACSKGLPGCENVDIPATRKMLDEWAEHVRSQTERNYHIFTDHPEKFANSESYFKALMMVVILHEDMGIHYNDERMKDGDYTHGEDYLINGLVGPLREGTCASMPVLYVAIGRRLGYPLYLVATQRHCFCRWESKDGKVRFNLEGTGNAVHAYPDDFYTQWPRKLTDFDMSSGVFLRNMSGMQEFASFLMVRGDVLEALERMPEAELAYAEAHSIIPDHFMFLADLAIGLDREKMTKRGLLDPNNPANPYRNAIPAPDDNPPSDVNMRFVHDEGAKK